MREGGVALVSADLTADLRAAMPDLRGRLLAKRFAAPTSPGFASAGRPRCCSRRRTRTISPIFCAAAGRGAGDASIGLGSNLIVRDGGVPGVVIRLAGKGFGTIAVEDGAPRPGRRRRAGREGRARRRRGRRSPAWRSMRGIPGAIGGALRMNAGAYGGETKDVLVEARGVDRQRRGPRLQPCRHGLHLPPLPAARRRDLHQALFQGRPGDPAAIQAEMERDHRSARGRPSRSRRRPAARPSRTRPAARPGSWSTRPAAGASSSAGRRCPRCTATS